MGIVQEKIEEKLREHFQPLFMDVENESHKHNVPPGSEAHFKVTVVSEKFAATKMTEQHQMVYDVLGEELEGPVHALSIRTKTPEQWQRQKKAIHQTPPCLGGGKP